MTGSTTRAAVFVPYGWSVRRWREFGFYSHESERLESLEQRLGEISLVTFDAPPCEEAVGSIPILANRRGWPHALYGVLAPLLHWRALRRADVFFADQVIAAATAMVAKFVCRRPMVLRAGYFFGDPVRLRRRGPFFRAAIRAFEFLAYRYADGVVVTTPPLGRAPIPSWQRLEVIPNGINTDRFRPVPRRARGEADNFTVGFVGRFVPEKNAELILDAIQSLPVRAVLVGDGPLRERLEERRHSADNPVELPGRVPQERLPELFARMDAFLLPSAWEGSPKALLEAMACGVPPISTRWDGVDVIIRDGENGVLCDASPESIREAIERLRRDPGLAERLGAAARESVLQRFSRDAIADAEARFIREVAGTARKGGAR